MWVKKIFNLYNIKIYLLYYRMMGFRTHYPKIWYLTILNILSWRNLRNRRMTSLFPWKEITSRVKSALPVPERRETSPEKGRFRAQKAIKTIFTTSPFTIHSPNPFVLSILHKSVFVQRYKNCLLWLLLLVFILLWRVLCTYKNSMK